MERRCQECGQPSYWAFCSTECDKKYGERVKESEEELEFAEAYERRTNMGVEGGGRMIELGKDHRLTADEYNIILQERRVVKTGDRKGEVDWRAIRYYKGYRQALDGLARRSIAGLHDVQTIVDKLDEVQGVIEDAADRMEAAER